MKSRNEWALPAAAVVMLVAALYLTFVWVPTERTMGIVQRIFYFHVPSFFTAVVAFLVGMIAGIRFLMTRDYRFDEVAVASNEIGVVFVSVNLITGSIWARPIWGIWWTWDARLTSAFVLWLMYVAYLILRPAVDEPGLRGVISAVFSIFAFVDVPIVYMSIRWWRTQHPQPVLFGGEGSGLDPNMRFTLYFCFLAMLALYACLLQVRRRLEGLRREAEGLRRTVHAG
ncbi:MAG TPA: cytochrome c biogenesis protein CcsA [Bryobacterales bacterium]|nr:cytochrome c biogenesis protein CcsA [Bryobacterales bacterium]